MTKKLSELYAPKPKGEKDFVEKHKTKMFPGDKKVGTDNDAQFKGTPVKAIDRTAKRMGYNPGADEKSYDNGEALGPNDQNPPPETGSTLYPSGKFRKEDIDDEEIVLTDDDIEDLLDILDNALSEEFVSETSGRDFARGVNPKHPATTVKSGYSKVAVDKAIASSNRGGRKIGGAEAKKIHSLLKGWRK